MRIKHCERCACPFEARDRRDYYCNECLREIFNEMREQQAAKRKFDA